MSKRGKGELLSLSFERSLTKTARTQQKLLLYNHETITEVINNLI